MIRFAMQDPRDRLQLSEKEKEILRLFDSLDELELEKQLLIAQQSQSCMRYFLPHTFCAENANLLLHSSGC